MPPRLLRLLPVLAVLHVAVLVAIRLWTDADDFNNWDLIGFLNANAFPSLGAVLALTEVHFARPFSFPMYNTGAESVVSTVVHRAMSGVSLYWSSTVVLLVHDLVFFSAVAGLFRLLFADTFLRAAAWMLVAMSPVLLTFPSTLSFDMQGFSTIALGMLGCECILASRRAAGAALLALAFLTISQAYPLSFFLPLFCAVWTGSRAMQRMASDEGLGSGYAKAVALAAVLVVAGVAVVEVGSGGAYLSKTFGVVEAPIRYQAAAPVAEADRPGRVAQLLETAFLPTPVSTGVQPAFAPFGVLAVLLALAALAAVRIRPTEGGAAPWLRGALTTAAWSGLVVFGYMPAAFGMNAKSQRCYFGDLFLVMATVALLGWVLRRVELPRAKVLAALVAVLLACDARYLSAVLAVDHGRNHEPVFDFDPADGVVRHDLQRVLETMREQVETEKAGILLHYPRGRAENSTDPALFHARMLRFFGPWQQRADVAFTCTFCAPRYGCPFPETIAKGCRKKCCLQDAVETVSRSRYLLHHPVYLWWHNDPLFPPTPMRDRLLKRLSGLYTIRDLGAPGNDQRWRLFRLSPRKGAGARSPAKASLTEPASAP